MGIFPSKVFPIGFYSFLIFQAFRLEIEQGETDDIGMSFNISIPIGISGKIQYILGI